MMDTIEIPFGAKDSELKGWEYTIPEGMEAVIENGKVIVREKEGEDERIRKGLINFLRSPFIKENLTDEKTAPWLAYLEKQKEQKPTAEYIPKFKVGDKVVSTKNPRLTYNIIEAGLINELGKPDYRVEIFADGIPGIPELKKEHNIQLIDCQKMDSWGELIEQKSAQWDFPYGLNETVDKLTTIAECLEMDGDCLFNGYSGTNDLEEAAEEWCKENHKGIALAGDKKSHYLADGLDAFIAGASWQREQDLHTCYQ